jgi:hypothetical protein
MTIDKVILLGSDVAAHSKPDKGGPATEYPAA